MKKIAWPIRWLVLLTVVILTGCGSFATPLRTPVGPISADYFEDFDLIGVSEIRTHRRVGPTLGSINVEDFEIPPGTEFIIPVVSGWKTWFGEDEGSAGDMPYGWGNLTIIPDHWEIPSRPDDIVTDRLGFTDIFVGNNADQITGVEQKYRLLFLRRTNNALVPAPSGGVEQFRIIGEDATFQKAFGVTDGQSSTTMDESISVPDGTEQIVSALQGFVLGYGDYSGPIGPAVRQPGRPDQNHVNQMMVDVDLSGTGATRTAEAELLLRDDDGVDPWYGAADYRYLSIKREDGTPGTSLRIVGIAGRGTTIQSEEATGRTDSPGFHREMYQTFVPAETDLVVPLLRGWSLGFGQLFIDPEPIDYLWNRGARHYGVGQVSLYATSLRPGPTPDFKQVTIMATLGLRGSEGVHDWFGQLNYTLLCLQIVDG